MKINLTSSELFLLSLVLTMLCQAKEHKLPLTLNIVHETLKIISKDRYEYYNKLLMRLLSELSKEKVIIIKNENIDLNNFDLEDVIKLITKNKINFKKVLLYMVLSLFLYVIKDLIIKIVYDLTIP